MPNETRITSNGCNTAYINGKIDKELYIEQPEEYEEDSKPCAKYVNYLNKALYGLKQARQLWN